MNETDSMTNDPSEAVGVVKGFLAEVLNGGNLAALDEFWARDLAWHGGSLGEIRGLGAYRDFLMANTSGGAFSGMHLRIDDVVAEGAKVVVRFTNSGTHTGPFLGTPPTHRQAEWLGIGIYTVRQRRITEAWFSEDVLGLLQQLGVITLPAATA